MEMATPVVYFLDWPANKNDIGKTEATPKPVIKNPNKEGQKKGNKIKIPTPRMMTSALIINNFSMPIKAINRSVKKRDTVIELIKTK